MYTNYNTFVNKIIILLVYPFCFYGVEQTVSCQLSISSIKKHFCDILKLFSGEKKKQVAISIYKFYMYKRFHCRRILTFS